MTTNMPLSGDWTSLEKTIDAMTKEFPSGKVAGSSKARLAEIIKELTEQNGQLSMKGSLLIADKHSLGQRIFTMGVKTFKGGAEGSIDNLRMRSIRGSQRSQTATLPESPVEKPKESRKRTAEKSVQEQLAKKMHRSEQERQAHVQKLEQKLHELESVQIATSTDIHPDDKNILSAKITSLKEQINRLRSEGNERKTHLESLKKELKELEDVEKVAGKEMDVDDKSVLSARIASLKDQINELRG